MSGMNIIEKDNRYYRYLYAQVVWVQLPTREATK